MGKSFNYLFIFFPKCVAEIDKTPVSANHVFMELAMCIRSLAWLDKLELRPLKGNLNARKYQNILENCVILCAWT